MNPQYWMKIRRLWTTM